MKHDASEASTAERGAVAPRPEGDAERMDEMKLESLKARVRSSRYVVDPEAVAEAILRRMLAAQQARLELAGGSGHPGFAGPGSGDVLEAG
jgi:hypothetical protein